METQAPGAIQLVVATPIDEGKQMALPPRELDKITELVEAEQLYWLINT